MFAQVLSLLGRRINFWVLEGILVLGTVILAWGYSRALLPDLRPCTKTTMAARLSIVIVAALDGGALHRRERHHRAAIGSTTD